jgi:hypothetical protein
LCDLRDGMGAKLALIHRLFHRGVFALQGVATASMPKYGPVPLLYAYKRRVAPRPLEIWLGTRAESSL